jgi:uncharacterized protein (DUF362 family)
MFKNIKLQSIKLPFKAFRRRENSQNKSNRMKKLFAKKNITFLIVVTSILVAICWDIATSLNELAGTGTFCLLSRFDAASAPPATVAIVPSDYSGLSNPASREGDITFEQVQAMVDKAIELQGGLTGIIKKGDKVMIKVNLVGKNSPSGQGENTDARVVKALIKNIYTFTGGDVEITIAEGSARNNDDINSTASVWAYSGYRDLLTDPYLTGVNFKLLNLNQSSGDLQNVDLGSKGVDALQGTVYHIHKAELQTNVYIAVPVLKIHDTGITAALKLQIGTAPGCYYGYNKTQSSTNVNGLYHEAGLRKWNEEAIVDLSMIADIDFVLVDALMCLETQKTYDGSNQLRMNTVIAGKDPVAVDNVCTRLFCMNPDDITHITLAEKAGLGTNDTTKITIVGAPIEQVKKRAGKNQSMHGKWGQSNVIWILSQPFAGTNINTAYIAGEDTIKPLAGKNGWSQPIYFFDDRIDLYNYYSGASNIVTYAFTYFNAPANRQAQLWLGSEEALSVFLNGEKVFTGTYTGSEIGNNQKTINIKKGENTLLVKSLNTSDDYTFGLNICEVENDAKYAGTRIAGLKFYTKTDTSSDPNPVNKITNPANEDFALKAFPNPANTYTIISYGLSKTAKTNINIYDVNGRLITNLENRFLSSGKHEINWNLSDKNGSKLKSGIYFCIIKAGNSQKSIKILIK